MDYTYCFSKAYIVTVWNDGTFTLTDTPLKNTHTYTLSTSLRSNGTPEPISTTDLHLLNISTLYKKDSQLHHTLSSFKSASPCKSRENNTSFTASATGHMAQQRLFVHSEALNSESEPNFSDLWRQNHQIIRQQNTCGKPTLLVFSVAEGPLSTSHLINIQIHVCACVHWVHEMCDTSSVWSRHGEDVCLCTTTVYGASLIMSIPLAWLWLWVHRRERCTVSVAFSGTMAFKKQCWPCCQVQKGEELHLELIPRADVPSSLLHLKKTRINPQISKNYYAIDQLSF